MLAVGFAAGAGGSAWQTREHRAEPWRGLRVEHQGGEGVTTRTRVVFDDPERPIQGVEVLVGPDGQPQQAHVQLPGAELSVGYEAADERPAWIEGPDGGRALFSYKGSKVWVGFRDEAGTQVAEVTFTVPVELRSALAVAELKQRSDGRLAVLWEGLTDWSPIGEAWAQPQPKEEDPNAQVTVQREVQLKLGIRVPDAKGAAAGPVQIEASCPPFTCLPLTGEAPMPGDASVRVAVSGAAKRSELKAPASKAALGPFEKAATEERAVATRVLPHVVRVVAAVGVTAYACEKRGLAWPVCVQGLGKKAVAAAGAVHAIEGHTVKTSGPIVSERAEELYYEEQARALLDKATRIQVCATRSGYSRGCTNLDGRPFAVTPMAPGQGIVELRRGLGGTLMGSFTLMQSDGADCKFSPSPRSSGKLSLSYDNASGVMTAKLSASERGTRPALRCSLGTGTMHWDQSYSVNATQSFSKEQMGAGGKLALRLTGTMQGAGGFSWSGCQSSGGGSVSCPGGKRDSYNYPAEIQGTLDLDSQTGAGRIVVSGAPLSTQGTWRIPAEGTK